VGRIGPGKHDAGRSGEELRELPGEFITVGPTLTLSQAIARAGGIKLSSDDGPVLIIRRGPADKPEFLLLLPFTPNNKNNMVAWLSARSSGELRCIAAPIPVPTMAISEMGVFRTRSGPNSSTIPCVTPIEPPISAMSSPMMKTSSSCRIACTSASRTASR